MVRAGSNERQKEFIREYGKLCHRFNRHEVWQDFVWMTASAISNAVDHRHAEKREERYLTIIRKYTQDEAQVFPTLFALIVAGMEEDPDQDFLGELYMELELGNSNNGQFFTPYDVCKAMAKIAMDADLVREHIHRQGYISINDPACGAGATLIAAAMVLKDMNVNYQQQAIFIAQDIDYTVGLMCYIQLALLGCAGYVRIGNTLTDPITGNVLFGDNKDSTWYTPMYFSQSWQVRRAVEKARLLFRAITPDFASAAIQNGSTISAMEKTQEARLQQTTEANLLNDEPTLVVSTMKKNAGQLMFDLGGLI